MKSITFGSSISPTSTRRIAAGITIGIEARTASPDALRSALRPDAEQLGEDPEPRGDREPGDAGQAVDGDHRGRDQREPDHDRDAPVGLALDLPQAEREGDQEHAGDQLLEAGDAEHRGGQVGEGDQDGAEDVPAAGQLAQRAQRRDRR